MIISLLTPFDLTIALAMDLMDLNLQQGLNNNLNALLNPVENVLDDLIAANDQAAVTMLLMFISKAEELRGQEISEMDAQILIDSAQEIIDTLNGP